MALLLPATPISKPDPWRPLRPRESRPRIGLAPEPGSVSVPLFPRPARHFFDRRDFLARFWRDGSETLATQEEEHDETRSKGNEVELDRDGGGRFSRRGGGTEPVLLEAAPRRQYFRREIGETLLRHWCQRGNHDD